MSGVRFKLLRNTGGCMGWSRGRDRRYWYYSRAKRVGGRIITQYIGGGDAGERAAAEDAQRRAQRRAERETRLAEQQRWSEAQTVSDDLSAGVDLLMQLLLILNGYHRHDGGEWRRRRSFRKRKGSSDEITS